MRWVRYSAVLLMAGAVAAFGQTPVVSDGGVLNAGSFALSQPVAPGSLVSIFGTDLAASLAQADSIPLSNSLADVSVTFNGNAAPLLFVSAGQINAQLPWTTPAGTAQVVVKRGSNSSQAVNFPVASMGPGIFTILGTGQGQAIAYNNSDNTFAAPNGSISGLTTRPAKIGDQTTLVILATGLGPVDPPANDGDNVFNDAGKGILHKTVTTPTVLVGNVPAQVVFSGLSPQFVGIEQLNIVIAPGTPTGDAVPLQIVMGGITTSNKVTIAVTN